MVNTQRSNILSDNFLKRYDQEIEIREKQS